MGSTPISGRKRAAKGGLVFQLEVSDEVRIL